MKKIKKRYFRIYPGTKVDGYYIRTQVYGYYLQVGRK